MNSIIVPMLTPIEFQVIKQFNVRACSFLIQSLSVSALLFYQCREYVKFVAWNGKKYSYKEMMEPSQISNFTWDLSFQAIP